jgi:acetolactate synthase-1/3 small subunit
MTFRVEADDDMALRIEANLYKMVNVLSVEDISQKPSVSRDLALIKVNVGAEKRPEVLQLCEVFRARAVDVGPETLIVEITGTQDKIDGLVAILQPFGIAEMVQTGALAMTRGPKGGAAQAMEQPTSRVRGVSAA